MKLIDVDDGKKQLKDSFDEFFKEFSNHLRVKTDKDKYMKNIEPVLEDIINDCDTTEELYDLLWIFSATFTAAARYLSDGAILDSVKSGTHMWIVKAYTTKVLDDAIGWRKRSESDEDDESEDDDDSDYYSDELEPADDYDEEAIQAARERQRIKEEKDRRYYEEREAERRNREMQRTMIETQLAQLRIQKNEADAAFWANGRTYADRERKNAIDRAIYELENKLRNL